MPNALRGQFEIELPDGTQVACLLNTYAVAQWCEEKGHTLTDLDEQLNKNLMQALPDLTWSGVRTHYELNETEPPIGEKRYKILLGSADWEQIASHMATALNLDPSEGGAKKKTKTKNR